MTDGVFLAVAVGLVKKVDFAIQHDCGGRAKPVFFAGVLRLHGGDFLPTHQITARGNADPPTLQGSLLRLPGRHGIVEEIPAFELHHRRILGKRTAALRVVAEHHDAAVVERLHIDRTTLRKPCGGKANGEQNYAEQGEEPMLH